MVCACYLGCAVLNDPCVQEEYKTEISCNTKQLKIMEKSISQGNNQGSGENGKK